MSEQLKTQTISFKNYFNDDVASIAAQPTNRLASKQIQAYQVAPTIQHQVEQKEIVKQPKKTLKQKNPYYSFIPTFYLKELKIAKITFIIFAILFSVVFIGSLTLIGLVLTKWKENINPCICLFLLIPNVFFLVNFIIKWNNFRNFNNEAKDINFRDTKVLSTNVLKVYRRLKTSYIDINWFSFMSYIIIGLTLFVDAVIVGILYKNFGGFYRALEEGQYTYFVIAVVCFVSLFIIISSHLLMIVGNYLRASNIENYYNFAVVDPTEMSELKKHKNRRDAIIFAVVIGSIFFLCWFIVKLVRNRNGATKVIVK